MSFGRSGFFHLAMCASILLLSLMGAEGVGGAVEGEAGGVSILLDVGVFF